MTLGKTHRPKLYDPAKIFKIQTFWMADQNVRLNFPRWNLSKPVKSGIAGRAIKGAHNCFQVVETLGPREILSETVFQLPWLDFDRYKPQGWNVSTRCIGNGCNAATSPLPSLLRVQIDRVDLSRRSRSTDVRVLQLLREITPTLSIRIFLFVVARQTIRYTFVFRLGHRTISRRRIRWTKKVSLDTARVGWAYANLLSQIAILARKEAETENYLNRILRLSSEIWKRRTEDTTRGRWILWSKSKQ